MKDTHVHVNWTVTFALSFLHRVHSLDIHSIGALKMTSKTFEGLAFLAFSVPCCALSNLLVLVPLQH